MIRFYGIDVPGEEEWELFDLKTDPTEMNSVYGEEKYEKISKRLRKELARLKDYYDVPEHSEPEVRQPRV